MSTQTDVTESASVLPGVAEEINQRHRGTFAGALGLRVLRASRDEVVAEVAVEPRLLQPYGIVHGGVHTSIVETLASIGGALDAKTHGKTVVGLENQTSFIRAVRGGTLRATARPLTRGRRSQVWEVSIQEEEGALVATGRVRLLLIEREGAG